MSKEKVLDFCLKAIELLNKKPISSALNEFFLEIEQFDNHETLCKS